MQHNTTHHRLSPASVLEHRRATDILRPFMGALPTWNGEAARLRARADSYYSTEEERVLARLASGALLAEVRRRHTELHAAIKGEPTHTRIDDVDSAFRRLIDQLTIVARREVPERSPLTSATWGVHQQDEQS